MPFIPVQNVAQVELRLGQWDQKIENTLYAYHPDGVTANRLKAVVESFADWWEDSLRPYVHSSVTFREAWGRDLTDEYSYTYTDTRYSGLLGQYVSGVAEPGNVTKCISFRTGLVGRSYRGRNYVIGLSSQMRDGNQIDGGIRDIFIGIYEELLFPSEWLGANWQWCIVSRFANHQPRTMGIHAVVTAVVVASDNLDSMRRRLTGRGD